MSDQTPNDKQAQGADRQKEADEGSKSPVKKSREDRLADALRTNLRRRKTAAKARKSSE